MGRLREMTGGKVAVFVYLTSSLLILALSGANAMGQPKTGFGFTCTPEAGVSQSTCDLARVALEQVVPDRYILTDQPSPTHLSVALQSTPLGLQMGMTYSRPDRPDISTQQALTIMDGAAPDKNRLYTRFFTRAFAALLDPE